MLLPSNPITDLLTKAGANLLKTGGILILANLSQQALKESASETMKVLTMDLRKLRTEYLEAKGQNI